MINPDATFSPATPYKAQLDGGEVVGYYTSLAEAQAALNATEKAKSAHNPI